MSVACTRLASSLLLLSVACNRTPTQPENSPARVGQGSAPIPAPSLLDPNLGLASPSQGFVEVALGDSQGCTRLATGKVGCWPFGIDDPRERPGVEDAVGLALGSTMSCALRTGGTVTCWRPRKPELEPTSIGVEDVTWLHAHDGGARICANGRDLTLRCWDGLFDGPSVPDWPTLRSVVPATYWYCGIDKAGSVLCWRSERLRPSDDARIPWLTDIHGLAISDNGLAAWNEAGELWRWDPSERLDIDDFRQPAVAEGVFRAAATDLHVCTLRLARGTDEYIIECLGPTAEVQELEGAQGPRTLAASRGRVCVTTAEGELWCWAHEADGEFGPGRKLELQTEPEPEPEPAEVRDPSTLPHAFPDSCPLTITRAKTTTHASLRAAAEVEFPGQFGSDDGVGWGLCETVDHAYGFDCPDDGPWHSGPYMIDVYVPEVDGSITKIHDVAMNNPGMEDNNWIEEYEIRATDPLDLYIYQVDAERECDEDWDPETEPAVGYCGLIETVVRDRVFTRVPGTREFLRLELIRDASVERAEHLGPRDPPMIEWIEGMLVIDVCELSVAIDPKHAKNTPKYPFEVPH